MIPDKFRETMDLEIMGTKVTVTTLVNGDKVSLEPTARTSTVTDKVKESMKASAT